MVDGRAEMKLAITQTESCDINIHSLPGLQNTFVTLNHKKNISFHNLILFTN